MKWVFAEITRGGAYPDKGYWYDNADTLIPLPDTVYHHDYCVPEERIILYWRETKEGKTSPLLWINDSGARECAINIKEWLNCMKNESYRSEHQKPISSKLPFHYHRIPSSVRNMLLAALIWLGKNKKPDKETFPRTTFNVGCEIFMSCCNIDNRSKMKKPVLILTHDIDTKNGFSWVNEIAGIEESYGFHSCWNVVPMHYPVDKSVLHKLLEGGHEIGMHGLWHNNREAFLSKNEMMSAFDSLEGFIKEFSIKGYRAPSWYRTITMFQVLSQYFSYDMSCLDVDLICPGGHGGVGFVHPFVMDSGLIEFPCTLPFEVPLFHGTDPEDLVTYWTPKIEFLKASNAMLLINTHPDPHYLGNDKMLRAYKELLGTLSDGDWQNMLPAGMAESMN